MVLELPDKKLPTNAMHWFMQELRNCRDTPDQQAGGVVSRT